MLHSFESAMVFEDIVDEDRVLKENYPELKKMTRDEQEVRIADIYAEKIEDILEKMEIENQKRSFFYAYERLNFLTSYDEFATKIIKMRYDGHLLSHVLEIQKTCEEAKKQMLPQMMESYGLSEQLKETDNEKYEGLMSNLKSALSEIILNTYVYVK